MANLTMGKPTTRRWTKKEKEKWEKLTGKKSQKPTKEIKKEKKPIELKEPIILNKPQTTSEKEGLSDDFGKGFYEGVGTVPSPFDIPATPKQITKTALAQGTPEGIGKKAGRVTQLAGALGIASLINVGAEAIKGATLTGKMQQVGKRIDVDAIGKTAGLTSRQTAALAKQVGVERINVLARWAVNQKTTSLTTSLLSKTFTTIKNPAFIVGAIGSYPFAMFIKEEAIQSLSIPIKDAINAGDLELAEKQVAEVEEFIEKKHLLLDKIPYANVYAKLADFFEATGGAMNAWRLIIQKSKQNAQEKAEEPSFAEERAVAEEEARQRDLEEMRWKAEYYELIREGKFEEADTLLKSQSE